MIDILLISDQTRLHDIVSAAGKLPDATLRIATSLDQGLSEITANTPGMILLQNRLSGLSGFILVRHVREQAGSAATRIVLLTDGMEGTENSGADVELLTGVTDTELADALAEIIGDQLGLNDQGAPERSPSPGERHPQPLLDTGEGDSVSLSTAAKEVALSSPARQAPRKQLPAPTVPVEEPIGRATVLNSSPPPIQWEKKRLVVAISVVAALSVAGALGSLLLRPSPPPSPPRQTASPPAALPVPGPIQKAPSSVGRKDATAAIEPAALLPSFIPAKGNDPAYSRENPGWERYTSSKREYKIYRESGKLRAVQVLDRQQGGVTTKFFTKVIREIAKSDRYGLVSSEAKGEYLIKKGKLSPTAEIILYKNRSDTLLRAFVIYFTDQGNPLETKGPHEPHRKAVPQDHAPAGK